MATSNLTLGVEIIGEFKRLTSATNGAKKNLTSMQRSAAAVSSGIMSSFAKIGLGLSFVALTRELKEATKAAVEDQKSQGLLANAMRNTAKATDAQIKAAEKSITKMSLQAAVADDKIRPAYSNLVRATGDVTKSTELMRLALDVAAGTGKDVEAVSKAMAKAVGPDGTTGALERLVPAIKGASDPMAVLEQMFAGAAETAANLDPYQRMKIAFDEIQESVGTALLPVLENFATWLVDIAPKIQQFFTDLTDPTTPMGEGWQNMTTAIMTFGDNFDIATGKVSDSASVWGGLLGWVGDVIREIEKLAFLLADVGTELDMWFKGDFIGAFEFAQNRVDRIRNFTARQTQAKNMGNFNGTLPSTSNPTTGFTGNITINTYNSNVTASDIVSKLNKAQRTNGSIGAAW
jgi:hypothetical protein